MPFALFPTNADGYMYIVASESPLVIEASAYRAGLEKTAFITYFISASSNN